MQASLQSKLTLGYLVIAALTLGVSLYTFEKIRVVEQKILMGERVSELLESAMEIRRFERNYFLHGQEADHLENIRNIENMQGLLKKYQADFVLYGVPESVPALNRDLDLYRQLMDQYAQSRQSDAAQHAQLERSVRSAGQNVVSLAEYAVGPERRLVRASLDSFRTVLVFLIVGLALSMIAMGQALSRRVVRPLKRLEQSVEAVQQGKRAKLLMPSQDRELVAIVTAFNQMLKELEQRQKHLMRSEKLASLGTMLSGVAHELNNPLSNIWSSCQILEEEMGASAPGMQRKLVMQIDEQSVRARTIVRSLLDFARDRQFNKESVLLRGLVEQTVQFIKGEIPPKVKVEVRIPEGITLFADRQRLQQAFLNLIKNAVEAVGAEGEVSISANRVTVADSAHDLAFPSGCHVEGSAIDIAVSDNGPGIEAHVLPRIFDPFFTTKDVGRGMGLGLFIVYQIVEEHGGCIFASSEANQGTAFHIRLPLQAA
ncbi:MAG: HAMP domain-containing sensor histidine kinase [Parasulfuritortus sp.]|nr:HAMP domain-containing sensor histidine kinase [Parasulfuritortus sp.]